MVYYLIIVKETGIMKTEVYITLDRSARVTLNNFWYTIETKHPVYKVWRQAPFSRKTRNMEDAIRAAH